MARTATLGTHGRLLAAGSALFAAHGFHGTTIRDIAARAGANVAAAHYHFGSKKQLYLAVLRAQFGQVRARFAAEAPAPDAVALARLPRAGVEACLRARVRSMLAALLGPPPGLHGALLQREMLDPSAALPVIVGEFVEPFTAELRAILARLAPGLDGAALERGTFSIVGQVLFYRFAMPIVLRRWKRASFDPGSLDALADHITRFSVAGVGGGPAARRRHAR